MAVQLLGQMCFEVSIYVDTVQWWHWVPGMCFKGFRIISSSEAARTRTVAQRSLKERGVVARHEGATMVRESKWP